MNNKFISIQELSEYINIPIGSLYVMCCYKKIPHYKIGRRTVFRLKDIDRWLEDKKVEEMS